jgi:hypothetical protein
LGSTAVWERACGRSRKGTHVLVEPPAPAPPALLAAPPMEALKLMVLL